MVNASLKNAMARRNHKERSQPAHRQRLGLLEKHKDYVHRARDYKSKQERIRKLREKAAFRNKDEFYYGMVKGKTTGGVAVGDRGNEALGVDMVKLLKTQDVGYVRVQIAKDERAISKIREELETTAPVAGPSSEWTAASELAEVEKLAEMGIVLRPQSQDRKGKGKARDLPSGHVIFTEAKAEFETYRPGNTEHTSSVSLEEATGEVDLGWEDPTPPRRKKVEATKAEARLDAQEMEEEARTHRVELLTSLSAHLSRVRLLRQAEQKLSTTKGLMGKGAARKVRDHGWVEDESVEEDRNGEKKRWEGKMWKWKLERRR